MMHAIQFVPQPRVARARRILLVQDDAELRPILASALLLDGHEVLEASEGGQTLARLARFTGEGPSRAAFDLLVCDAFMPLGASLRALEALRDAHWSMPAIFLSSVVDDLTRSRGMSLGAVVLPKPVDVDELRVEVGRLLRKPRGRGGVRDARPNLAPRRSS